GYIMRHKFEKWQLKYYIVCMEVSQAVLPITFSYYFIVATSSHIAEFVLNHRYVLTLMLFLSVVCFYSMRLCLHIALTKIAMPTPVKKEVQEEVCPGNNTQILEGGSYNWSEKDQGIILLSFFPGYILTHVPGGLLADKIGGQAYIIHVRYSIGTCNISYTCSYYESTLGFSCGFTFYFRNST
ncbi:hypothetical protein ILUMI_17171, partial [Ignelater luminosus]